MKIRSFIAINFSSEIRKQINDYLVSLKQFREPIRYVKSEGIHLTLKFLGNVDRDSLTGIQSELKKITDQYSPFSFTLEGNGAFPSIRNPRVLWIGCKVPETLFALQSDIETAMENLGFEREQRPFKPHLTLGRVKGRLSSDYIHYFEKHPFNKVATLTDRIYLMKSELSPMGARYHVISSFELKNR